MSMRSNPERIRLSSEPSRDPESRSDDAHGVLLPEGQGAVSVDRENAVAFRCGSETALSKNRHSLAALVALSCALLPGLAGCEAPLTKQLFSQTIWNPFGLDPLLPVTTEPVRIGMVTQSRSGWNARAWWDPREVTPWTLLRLELANALNRPVQFEPLTPFQIAAQLEAGRLSFAVLTTTQYEEVQREGTGGTVLVETQNSARRGLLVAKASSDLQALKDLAGKHFAFGPRGDPVLHYGAAEALEAAGVSLDDLARELVPINSLQYHISSAEAAKEIAFGLTPAGVLERAEYEQYPETGGQLLLLKFSKDQFRILGETAPIAFGPILVSPKCDAAVREATAKFLAGCAQNHPNVTTSLGVVGFTPIETTTPSASGR